MDIVEKEKKPPSSKKKDKPVSLRVLERYCADMGVTVSQVKSKSRDPIIANARQKIALALFEKASMDYRTIAALMKKSPSSVWSYLNSGLDNNSDRLVEKILNELPETYEKLRVLAKRDLRLPLDQIRFIVREYCDRSLPNG